MTDRPTPPQIAQYLLDGLDRQSPSKLRKIATYAEQLATWQETGEACTGEEAADTAQHEERSSRDRPAGVPHKASIVVKEIRNNQYHYWQWRDGDKIRSTYKGPVSPRE